jgi:glutaredoxin-like protein NrdH
MVTVYTKPSCVQCNATYRALDKKGIPYNSVDITVDDAAREELIALGYQQAPVVSAPIGNWSGYNPGKIDELAEFFAQPVG